MLKNGKEQAGEGIHSYANKNIARSSIVTDTRGKSNTGI